MSNFITKKYVVDLLNEVSKQMKCAVPKIRFVDEQTYAHMFKNTAVIKELFKLGVFESYADYPAFAGMFGNNIIITLKKAKRLLKGFPEPIMREYLKYVIAHELTHINKKHTGTFEEEIEACKEAEKVVDMEIYNIINKQLWKPIKVKLRDVLGEKLTSNLEI